MNDEEKAQQDCADVDAAVAAAEAIEQLAYEEMKRTGEGNPRVRVAWFKALAALHEAYSYVQHAYDVLNNIKAVPAPAAPVVPPTDAPTAPVATAN